MSQRSVEESGSHSDRWRGLEWFAGIGGFAYAWPECPIVAAIDIDATARQVYQYNRTGQYLIREIETFGADSIAELDANFWWMSPPCQPYSRRGNQCDVEDRRAASLLHLIDLIGPLRPTAIALENVFGFASSRACETLIDALRDFGYSTTMRELCPTQLGWPNRRPRIYLLASLEPLPPWRPLPHYDVTLRQLLRPAECRVDGRSAARSGDRVPLGEVVSVERPDAACELSEADRNRFGCAMDRVNLNDVGAVTACFGSSYGKSLLRAGSYLVDGSRWRRFTPSEVARLLGLPPTFSMPEHIGTRRRWQLLGNSLSIPVVRYVLSHLPGGPSTVMDLEAEYAASEPV